MISQLKWNSFWYFNIKDQPGTDENSHSISHVPCEFSDFFFCLEFLHSFVLCYVFSDHFVLSNRMSYICIYIHWVLVLFGWHFDQRKLCEATESIYEAIIIILGTNQFVRTIYMEIEGQEPGQRFHTWSLLMLHLMFMHLISFDVYDQ